MPNATTPTLIAFSGLPGVGKTTIARDLARGLEALYLRVDSIEAALKNSSLRIHPAEDAGYQALIAIARDNLANCLTVIADTVNPLQITRNWFARVVLECKSNLLNVEVVCSDVEEHRRRVENRIDQTQDHDLPTWEHVQNREFDVWTEHRLIVDTCRLSVAECIAKIKQVLPAS
jgi:predicted kinase